MVPGCLERGECISFPAAAGDWVKQGSATQRGRSPCFPHVLVHFIWANTQLSGHELAGGVGHCLLDCGGYRTPDEAKVCRGGMWQLLRT